MRQSAVGDLGAEEAVKNILSYIGEDVHRSGLKDTPARVVKSWAELFAGYKTDPASLLTVFDVPADEVVLVKNIRFTSFCEHHWLPFTGAAHVGYLPSGNKVVGLSKLARLVDCFAKRLQVQERMTRQVAEALCWHRPLSPLAVGVVVEATHGCMSCRGVMQPEAVTTTSCMLGTFRSDPAARAEFLTLVYGGR